MFFDRPPCCFTGFTLNNRMTKKKVKRYIYIYSSRLTHLRPSLDELVDTEEILPPELWDDILLKRLRN